MYSNEIRGRRLEIPQEVLFSQWSECPKVFSSAFTASLLALVIGEPAGK